MFISQQFTEETGMAWVIDTVSHSLSSHKSCILLNLWVAPVCLMRCSGVLRAKFGASHRIDTLTNLDGQTFSSQLTLLLHSSLMLACPCLRHWWYLSRYCRFSPWCAALPHSSLFFFSNCSCGSCCYSCRHWCWYHFNFRRAYDLLSCCKIHELSPCSQSIF